jgi:YD repeat-containing protein
MRNPISILLALLTLALTTVAASAQSPQPSHGTVGRTIYDARGNVVGRSSTDSSGTTTTNDARGKVIGRESTTPTKNAWPAKDDCYGRPAMMSGKPCH